MLKYILLGSGVVVVFLLGLLLGYAKGFRSGVRYYIFGKQKEVKDEKK